MRHLSAKNRTHSARECFVFCTRNQRILREKLTVSLGKYKLKLCLLECKGIGMGCSSPTFHIKERFL